MPTRPTVMPLDVFASKNPQGLGKIICEFEKLKSQDGEAEYGHTGIIQDANGKTAEAVWSIAEQNLFEAYSGKKVLIARWNRQTPEQVEKGLVYARKLLGRKYPYHRLILHMLGVARWVHILKTPVCSEYTAATLIEAGADLICGNNFWGVSPDYLADDWNHSKHFDVIYEGVLP